MPAEVFHPSEYITEEIEARGWTLDRLAHEMGGDYGITRLALDLYIEVGPTEPALRIGQHTADQLAKAFGTSADLWTNLEAAWLRGPAAGAER